MHKEFYTTLLDISRQLSESRTLDPVLDYAMDAALELFGAEYGHLILLNDDGTLDFRVGRTKDGQKLTEPRAQISQTILNTVIEDEQGLVIGDAISSRDFQSSESVVGLQLRSVICVPLISRDRVLGVIYLENRSMTHRFSQDDLDPLKLFACQAAVAIENATLNEALEAKVAARTAELQSRTDELDAFAHTVAHDLQTPVTSIIGYATILQEEYDALEHERKRAYLQAIVRSGRKMGSIIESLLLLASVRKEDVPVEPLNMEWIVGDVLQRLTPMVEEYHAEIVVPGDWPVALGYAPWIEEVWTNYLSNALRYGGKPPHIELGADIKERRSVRFWVRDNGPGLAPEDQVRLFTPYTQLHQGPAKGQGLGLSIVQRIIEKLNGQVGVESQVGKGSVFSFTLPGAGE